MRQFWCDTCQIKEPLSAAEFKSHLETVHQFDGKVTGNRKLVCAIDGDEYSNTFEWRLAGGVKATEVSSGKKVT